MSKKESNYSNWKSKGRRKGWLNTDLNLKPSHKVFNNMNKMLKKASSSTARSLAWMQNCSTTSTISSNLRVSWIDIFNSRVFLVNLVF